VFGCLNEGECVVLARTEGVADEVIARYLREGEHPPLPREAAGYWREVQRGLSGEDVAGRVPIGDMRVGEAFIGKDGIAYVVKEQTGDGVVAEGGIPTGFKAFLEKDLVKPLGVNIETPAASYALGPGSVVLEQKPLASLAQGDLFSTFDPTMPSQGNVLVWEVVVHDPNGLETTIRLVADKSADPSYVSPNAKYIGSEVPLDTKKLVYPIKLPAV
jgi:hypothetical protein